MDGSLKSPEKVYLHITIVSYHFSICECVNVLYTGVASTTPVCIFWSRAVLNGFWVI